MFFQHMEQQCQERILMQKTSGVMLFSMKFVVLQCYSRHILTRISPLITPQMFFIMRFEGI